MQDKLIKSKYRPLKQGYSLGRLFDLVMRFVPVEKSTRPTCKESGWIRYPVFLGRELKPFVAFERIQDKLNSLSIMEQKPNL